MTRRQFHKLILASLTSAAGLPACTGDDSERDAARLAERMQREAAASGTGPYGPLRFRGYRGLAELPYFELAEDGSLRLTLEDAPPAVDFHTHLGMHYLFAPEIDFLGRAPRTRYLLDCDVPPPGCDLDLDVYINSAFDEERHAALSREVRNQVLFGSDAAATHTIPNLLAEMDAVGCRHAVLHAIAPGFPFGDDVSRQWLDAVDAAAAGDRLIVFASVHPAHRGWREQLGGFARRGARGVKIHPEFQRLFPDEPRVMEIYQECERLGLPVFFHGGRSGIEPGFMRKYALLRRYEPAIEAFPRLPFILGHAGARDVDDAVDLARRHANVWLEITGQGVTQLDRILRDVDNERLLFGSDWPFYPLAATLAKVLIVTEKRREARAAILSENARRLLRIAG